MKHFKLNVGASSTIPEGNGLKNNVSQVFQCCEAV
jgi:hypothetical protein